MTPPGEMRFPGPKEGKAMMPQHDPGLLGEGLRKRGNRMKRTVFFLSDHTGITVEALGRSLLSQFAELEYDVVLCPFIDTPEKARHVARRVMQAVAECLAPPLVFSTLVDERIRNCFDALGVPLFDFLSSFTGRLEDFLRMKSTPVSGRYHSMASLNAYSERIHAVNYALVHDDGAVTRSYDAADVILVGVSRSGKTPSCLYLALQHGILAANYPLTEDDHRTDGLPKALREHRAKLFGLTIDPAQLQRIRRERRPQGRYASAEQCRREVLMAEALFRTHRIPYLDTTSMSVEEIAASLIERSGVQSRVG
jgi:regulator of PEP synthase PpsR (kinase-PPPase family)